jgi:hypothetical protein
MLWDGSAIFTDEGDVDVLKACVVCCSDGDMTSDCVHGGVAGDDAARAIAVVDVEFNVGQAIVCDGANL